MSRFLETLNDISLDIHEKLLAMPSDDSKYGNASLLRARDLNKLLMGMLKVEEGNWVYVVKTSRNYSFTFFSFGALISWLSDKLPDDTFCELNGPSVDIYMYELMPNGDLSRYIWRWLGVLDMYGKPLTQGDIKYIILAWERQEEENCEQIGD